MENTATTKAFETVLAIHRSGIYWFWWKSNSQQSIERRLNIQMNLHGFIRFHPRFSLLLPNCVEIEADCVWMNSICSSGANLSHPIKDYFYSLGKCRKSQKARNFREINFSWFHVSIDFAFDGFLMPPQRHCNPFKITWMTLQHFLGVLEKQRR